MDETGIASIQRLAPDLMRELGLRALVLERIAALQPVGRRALASRLRMPEREIRAIASSLKEAELISLDASGMSLSPAGFELLPSARELSRQMRGITKMEKHLADTLNIERVIIVSGDADEDKQVLREVGRAAAAKLRSMLRDGMIVAITGGTTMSEVATSVSSQTPMNIMIVPARGGVGRAVETQASTLAAEMARRLGAHHRLMHIPDHLDAGAMSEMLKLPEVRETIELCQRADIVIHGIGRADDMAQQHGLSGAFVSDLSKKGAVAEAFGSYYDRDGNVVCVASSVGIDPTRLKSGAKMAAVAAGKRKAEAMTAILRRFPHAILVTDEGAAEGILEIIGSN